MDDVQPDRDSPIDAKRAIAIAKSYASEIFASESKTKPTLEEIWFDEPSNLWCVTVGIRHRIDLDVLMREIKCVDYKTVRVRASDGQVVSIRNHEVAA